MSRFLNVPQGTTVVFEHSCREYELMICAPEYKVQDYKRVVVQVFTLGVPSATTVDFPEDFTESEKSEWVAELVRDIVTDLANTSYEKYLESRRPLQ
jgi:hypothetical protein